jgi:hypothetical protein
VTLNIPTPGTTTPLQETSVRSRRRLSRLLADGFHLVLHNWPCVLWVYAVTLVFGLLTAVPVTYGLSPYIDHSLEAEKIAGTLNVPALAELGIHLGEDGFFSMVLRSARWVQSFELLLLFVLFAGAVVVFVSSEPARLSVLLREGVRYFWRFVRATVIAGVVALVLVGILAALRGFLLDRVSDLAAERQMFWFAAISGLVVAAVGMLVRLWWDLVEIYIARNAMEGRLRVRQTLRPALELLRRHFWSLAGGFLLPGLAALAAFLLCLYLWKLLPAHQVWGAMLLGQLGLFFLLAGRFWQRGVETVMVASFDSARVTREDLLVETTVFEKVIPRETLQMAPREIPVVAPASTPLPEESNPAPEPKAGKPATGESATRDLALPDSALREPTLRDLVMRLKDQPWASAEAVPDMPAEPAPPAPEAPRADPVTEPYTALLERHLAKTPLGTKPEEEEVAEAKAIEQVPEVKKPEDKKPEEKK